MTTRSRLIRLALGATFIIGAALVITWWPRSAGQAATEGEVWTCSMHPQVRLLRPGTCPICGMKLIPAAQLDAAKSAAGPQQTRETQAVVRRELFKEIRTVGKLDYNESRVEYITARIAGRVDRLYVDFTGIGVKQGDHLADVYSPELYSAQTELVRALEASEASKNTGRLADRFVEANLKAAREKLSLWGLLPEQIAEVERTRKERTHMTIYAPLSGTVIEKNVRLGQYIREGDQLYRIAELDPIWLYLDVYEYDIAWMSYGQTVDVALEAFPGETFHGIVTFIDPFLDDRTRTVRVRVNLKNPRQRLKAGMYASATIRVRLLASGAPAPTGLEGKYSCPMHPEVIRDQPGKCPICNMELIRIPEGGPFADRLQVSEPNSGEARSEHQGHDQQEHERHDTLASRTDANPLAIPASAVLDTGRRQIAYRATPDGNYRLVEIEVGPLATASEPSGQTALYYPVLKGLSENDQVIVRGGFLLDSQTQIEGRPSLLFPEGQSGAGLHGGHAGMSMPAPSSGGEHKH